MDIGVKADSIEELKEFQITSLDDDDEQEQEMVANEYEDDDDDEEDDEQQDPVALGFIEKPKNPWSLLRPLFLSKAGGPPAWLDPVNLPLASSCLSDMCGEPLQFVLQVLPQLLYYFGVKNDVDSLDWATIVVYICEASCEASVSYKEEFVWVQHYSESINVP